MNLFSSPNLLILKFFQLFVVHFFRTDIVKSFRSNNARSGRLQQKANIFDVELDLGVPGNLSLDTSAGTLQPLDTHPENNYPEPQIVRDVDDEQLFSKIVLQGWDRYFY